MMKRSLIAAAVLVAGGGAVAVGANPTNGMKGSDTLFDLTTAIFAACPGVAGVYAGSGSGNGQNAMISGIQQVAPMSRFLNNGGVTCTGAAQPVDAGGDGARSPISQAQGLVIGLDGVEIVGSKRTIETEPDGGGDGGTAFCHQIPNPNCDPNFAPNSSAAFNTTITTTAGAYTFTGWRDVLRVLLAGFDHSPAAQGTNAAAWAARDCNSPIRQAIANSYGSFFENNCSAQAGDTLGVCNAIRHVFRRDDFSGTTDTVVGLLGLPSIVNPETSVTVNFSGTAQSITQHTGATPFCNAVRPAFVFPAPTPQCLQGPDFTWDPTALSLGSCPLAGSGMPGACVNLSQACNPACGKGQLCQSGTCVGTTNCGPAGCTGTTPVCVGGAGGSGGTCTALSSTTVCAPGSCCRENAVYRSTMQDNDPIRRTCNGNEQVCNHTGNLGLVLPMNDVPEPNPSLAAGTNADRYNATACLNSLFVTGVPPEVFDGVTQSQIRAAAGTPVLCPNGDTVIAGTNACFFPAFNDASKTPTSNAQCMPAIVASPLPKNPISVPFVSPRVPGPDGRAWAQHLMAYATTGAVYQRNGFATSFPVTGAYYRIHTTRTLSPVPNPVTGLARTCQQADMTDQIGCLVEASPCSLGYAGRGSTENSNQNNNVMSEAVNVNGQTPIALCIQGGTDSNGNPVSGFAYPLSRKLYLNSLPGFAAVTGQELQLAGCETDLAQANLGTPAGLMTTGTTDVAQFGFLHIGPIVTGQEPYCEDFNEQVQCPSLGVSNVNACATAPANLAQFPTVNTVCGNGVREAYEDCDPAPGGTLPIADPTECIGGQGVCSNTCRCL